MFDIQLTGGAINIDSFLNNIQEKLLTPVENGLIDAAEMACLEVVKEAREQPSPGPYPDEMRGFIGPHQPNYIDWTGNLRGSIGYTVFYDGIEKRTSFNGGLNEGGQKGKQAAAETAGKNVKGLSAAIVAGENYALSVESYGYNVITEQCSNFKRIFDDYLKDVL